MTEVGKTPLQWNPCGGVRVSDCAWIPHRGACQERLHATGILRPAPVAVAVVPGLT